MPKVKKLRQEVGVIARNCLKESIMDDTTQLEIVDLGEAKEVTKGTLMPPLAEDNSTFPFQHIG